MTRKRHALLVAVIVSFGLLAMATTAAAWSKNTHVHIGEVVAEEGGADAETVAHMAELSQWADEPSTGEMYFDDEATDGSIGVADTTYNIYQHDDGEPDVTSGTWGYNAEYNPWYQQLVGTVADEVVEGGSALNFDHWLSVHNYDSWWGWPEGKAHENSAEFVDNAKYLIDEGNTEEGIQVLGRGQHYMQDMGVTYHVVAWDNFGGLWDQITEGTDSAALHHFEYEGYVGDVNGDPGTSDRYRTAMQSGAERSWTYEVEEKDDIRDLTVGNARFTLEGEDDQKDLSDVQINDYDGTPKNDIMPTRYPFSTSWEDEEGKEATEAVLEETSARTAAVYTYAAPGVFDYDGELVEPEDDGGLWDWFTSLLWGWW